MTETTPTVPSSYPPPQQFAEQANARAELYREAEEDRLVFWAKQANRLSWATPFTEVLDWSQAPFAQWFVDGKLNIAYNCVDRHVEAGHGDRVAIYWEGEPTNDRRSLTYSNLLTQMCKAANALTNLGLVAGDRVAIYMPLIPEAVIAMLACARLGIMHNVVFSGFTATTLHTRIADSQAKLLITTDGQFRRGKPAPLKAAADEAVEQPNNTIEHVLVVRRTGIDVPWNEGRDLWWHDVIDSASPEHTPKSFDAEHPLFLLYTSGTTGKPKGIVHTSGGYLTQSSYTVHTIFDVKPDSDVFWCTADIGWITGHTYGVYGPLSNGITEVLYEGTPDTPDRHRHFQIIERYGVTIYYTAPTLIRTFMKWGRDIPGTHDLSSLRLLGSVGEPINPEAWRWYREVIGAGRVPVVDTWWQTETGSAMISPLPGVTAAKPGSAMTPLPGISAKIVDDHGNPLQPGADDAQQLSGYLVLDQPWPSMLRGIWGDPERYRHAYWSKFAGKGLYFAGDGARFDPDGAIWVLGRIDDVMNVSGHRISTAEVESALVGHSGVAEAAVVGVTDDTTTQAICAFVVLRANYSPHNGTVEELRSEVARVLSPIARPREVHVVPELPKTRSGKIVRRLLRDVAENRELGDTSTLLDPTMFDAIRTSGTSK